MEELGKRRDVDQIAADWLTRMDRGPLTAVEQAAFDNWLHESPLHRGACARAQALLTLVDHADMSINLQKAPAPFIPVLPQSIKVSRRRMFAIAASVAAVATGVTIHSMPDPRFKIYQTVRGEVRAVPLEDGSLVTLNTSSKIAVRFKRDAREIKLLEGEALFDVAKDTNRPFTVDAGNMVVRAVGTSFLVSDLADKPVELLVREGAVDFFPVEAEQTQALRVNANSRAVALQVPYPSAKLVDTGLDPRAIARQLAWRSGIISFEDESLDKAVATFGRYSSMRIVIDDPEIANQTVTGLFSIHNPEEFARSVALSLDLKISVTSDGVMLWR